MAEGERKIEPTDLEWDHLGRLPLYSKLDGLLIQRGMIQETRFLDQRLTSTLRRLDSQSEVISGRVGSIVLSRVEKEKEGTADVFVTKFDIKNDEKGVSLVPGKRVPTDKVGTRFNQEDVYRTLSKDNELFFVVDRR